MLNKRDTRKWILPSIVVGILTVILLLATNKDIGLTWDEPIYMSASESYTGWFELLLTNPVSALGAQSIHDAWEANHEHPPFQKEFSGVVWALTKGLTDDLTAHRLGDILLVGLMAGLLFHLLASELGIWSGLASIVALLAMPRFFFHAHLAGLDTAAACMIVVVVYVFWQTRESSSIRSVLLLGVALGLAISTKITTIIVFPVFLLWILLFRRTRSMFLRLIASGLLALLAGWILWPWMYFDTFSHVFEYVAFPLLAHWSNRAYYLGRIYTSAPWHYPFVIIWAVVPLGTIILYLLGIIRTVIDRTSRTFLGFLFLSALTPMVLQSLGRFVAFDSDRFLMPTFPFLAALAGAGFGWAVAGLAAILRRSETGWAISFSAIGLAIVAVLSPLNQMVQLYPHLLSYFSEQVGGLPGSVPMGFETTYWCETYRDAIDFINREAEPGNTIWVEGTSYRVLQYYQAHGILRADVVFMVPPMARNFMGASTPFPVAFGDYTGADFVIVEHRESIFFAGNDQPSALREWMRAHRPAYQLEREGVMLMQVFDNRDPLPIPGRS